MGGGPKEHKTTTDTSSTTRTDVPDYLQSFIRGLPGVATTAIQDLSGAAQDYELPPESLEALRSTAAGEWLYGGPQMEAFTGAAQRAAMPGIFSAFGGAGRGTGGLAQAALGQAGIDAYASMYGDERSRQLTAATALPQLQMLPFEMQQKLLQSVGMGVGAFSPLFGQTTKGQAVQTQPIYKPSPWETALGIGSAGLGLASSFFPPAAAAKAAGGFGGGIAGGLLGAFR